MKNVIKSIAVFMIMVMVFNSCGSGGAPKVKDNPLLGNTLSILASYEHEQGKIRKKRDKEYEDASSFGELGKAKKKYEQKMEDLYSKYAQKAEEESNKIAGTEIPYVITDGLKYTIEGPVTIQKTSVSESYGGGLTLEFNIRILKNNLRITDRAYVVYMAGDKPIEADIEHFLMSYIDKVNIGDVVPIKIGVHLSGDLNKWSDFNLIKFTNAEEWNLLHDELEK